MKKLITLMLAVSLLFSLMMPQTAFAGESTETSTKTNNSYPFDLHVLPSSIEMESETSIRIFWYQDVPYQALQISWRKADEASNQTQSVRIDSPTSEELKKQDGKSSYVIEELSPNTAYIFTMQGILTGADGQEIFTKPWNIEGKTSLYTPKLAASSTNSVYINSYWDVRELNSILKLYRSETENGSYQLIGTFDARDKLDEPTGPTRQFSRFNCSDFLGAKNANKTYYYKAQAEIVKNGNTYYSAMSEPVALKTKYSDGSYIVKVLNNKTTTNKQLKLKLTSNEANYNTYLNNFKGLYRGGKKRIVKKAEYSKDGKKYYTLTNKNVLLKPGKSIYLRITTKSTYSTKDYKELGSMILSAKYNGEKNRTIKLYSREGCMKKKLDMSKLSRFAPNDADPTAFTHAYSALSYFTDARMQGKVQKDGSFLISWKPTNATESYAVRFGTTKTAVMYNAENPLIIPKNQVQTVFKNLDKNKTYYFSVIPCQNADGTEAYDGDHFYLKWNGKKFTELLQNN